MYCQLEIYIWIGGWKKSYFLFVQVHFQNKHKTRIWDK